MIHARSIRRQRAVRGASAGEDLEAGVAAFAFFEVLREEGGALAFFDGCRVGF